MEGGGWKVEAGGCGIGGRWNIEEDWGKAGVSLLFSPMRTLFKFVQAGKEWGESMEGSAGLIPHCLPTPAAHNAQDAGSSFPPATLAQHQLLQHLWAGSAPVHSRGAQDKQGSEPPDLWAGLWQPSPQLSLPAAQPAFLLW